MPSLNEQLAKKWTGKDCTLNGEPAHVGQETDDKCGRVILASNGTGEFWSWYSINRVMLKDGKFTT